MDFAVFVFSYLGTEIGFIERLLREISKILWFESFPSGIVQFFSEIVISDI